jgi:hypothetical protein
VRITIGTRQQMKDAAAAFLETFAMVQAGEKAQ